MITVNLHGKLGEDLGQTWELDVSSVAEALHAIDVNTKKLRHWLINYKDEYEYEILVDKNNLFTEQKDIKNIEEIKNSEFCLNIKDKIQTIDIIPYIAGSGGGFSKILIGGALILGAIALAVFTPFVLPAIAVGFVGLGLVAAGTSQLLSKPPPSIPFTAQQVNPIMGEGEAGGPTSYLFNGPVNTVGEGGPVPVGYGELIVGGNNVFSSYDIYYMSTVGEGINTGTLQPYGPSTYFNYLFNNKCYLFSQDRISSIPASLR
jgi:predicted phage tail protein